MKLFPIITGFCLVLLCASGCKLNGLRQRMYDQPKYEPLESSDFFADGRASRQLVKGTVPRKTLNEEAPVLPDAPIRTGRDADGKELTAVPFELTYADLKRGQERYNIYCSVCHGISGHSDGMVVRRGYQVPPSFHSALLREKSVGYVYSIATLGKGSMQPYADQVDTEDRWRIAAYVKSLQMSQNFKLPDGVSVDDLIDASHGGAH